MNAFHRKEYFFLNNTWSNNICLNSNQIPGRRINFTLNNQVQHLVEIKKINNKNHSQNNYNEAKRLLFRRKSLQKRSKNAQGRK